MGAHLQLLTIPHGCSQPNTPIGSHRIQNIKLL